MPQYLVAGYLPDDFDPSQADEATGREIHALNKEMIAAGVRKFACGLGSAKSLRARAMAESSSPTGPTLRPRNTLAVFGYWNALTWTRRWRGRAKASPPLGGRSRCARYSSSRQPTSNRAADLNEQTKVRERRRRQNAASQEENNAEKEGCRIARRQLGCSAMSRI